MLRGFVVLASVLVVACSSVDPAPNLGGASSVGSTQAGIAKSDVEYPWGDVP